MPVVVQIIKTGFHLNKGGIGLIPPGSLIVTDGSKALDRLPVWPKIEEPIHSNGGNVPFALGCLCHEHSGQVAPEPCGEDESIHI